MKKGAPVLVVVFGLPGTGKTTFAESLAAHLKLPHYNTDKIRSEMGLRGRYDPATKTQVYNRMLERTEAELRDGNHVILDGTFYLKGLRKSLRALAGGYRARIYWIEISAGEQTVAERVSRTRPFSEADFAAFTLVKQAFEPLEEEHLTLFSDRMTAGQMLEKALVFIDP